LGEINAQVEDSLSGVRVVRSFTNEPLEQERFAQGNAQFTQLKAGAYFNMSCFSGGVELFSNIFNLITLVCGGYFVIRGQMSAGMLTAFLLYVGLFLQPIRKLTALVETYQRGMASFARFAEIMLVRPDIADREGARDAGELRGDIKFDHVSFRYNEGKAVLTDVCLDIRPGETIALVGPSGGGKSTLCNLIPRFYEAQSGAITIDGMDIRDMTQRSLRQNIGIVQQDVFLFSGTVRENIAYARDGASDDEIIAAASAAGAHAFIEQLPMGYDTYVGQRGVKLSGGQKQRVAIARIFLKNPPILLLDEATSALDNQTERIIQAALYDLSRQRTTLVIAHRLATIRGADRILVMTDEGVVESGDHAQLMELGGLYATLYNMQFEGMDEAIEDDTDE